jgi:hypothetical protein
MKTQIIDNALGSKQFKDIQHALLSHKFLWSFNDSIAKDVWIEGSDEDEDNYYFTNQLYIRNPNQKIISTLEHWPLQPLLRSVLQKDSKLIRVKANLYLRTDKIVHHNNHIDYEFEHSAAIFYINTNDGLTVLEDGTEIESVANRLLVFDGSKPHHSTTCTDQKRRVNINMNYITKSNLDFFRATH